MKFINKLIANRSLPKKIAKLDIKEKQKILEKISQPKKIAIEDSALMFYVHSVTEDARIRKIKEPWTVEWLRQLPKDAIFYDVGANIGITTLIPVELIERNISVVAFEPAPANFSSLVKNIELNRFGNRVFALPIGLGAVTDIAPFNLTTLVPGAAMHAFGEISYIKPGKSQQPVASHYCMRMRLDDFVHWKGIPFPTHIKIDVDGGEWDLLMGAAEVLKDPRCRALQIEVIDADANFNRTKQVTEFLAKVGFSVVASYVHKEIFPRVTDIQFAR